MNSTKGLMHNLKKRYKRYRTLNRRLDVITEMNNVLKATFFAIFASLVLVLIPTLMIINLFIYSKLTIILSIALYLVSILFIVLYYTIYYQLLSNYHEKIKSLNLKFLKNVEIVIVTSIITIVAAVALIALL